MVAEAMRRYPPIIGLARVAKSDDLLGDSPSKPCWSPRWPGGLNSTGFPANGYAGN